MQNPIIIWSVQGIVSAEIKNICQSSPPHHQQIQRGQRVPVRNLAVNIYAFRYTRTFWIKVKSIIKVSLDRLRMLKLLNERIFSRYEEIINLINKNYDEEKKIE